MIASHEYHRYPRMIPSGRLRVYAETEGFHTERTKRDVAKVTRLQNTPQYLHEKFFGPEAQIIQLNPVKNSGDVCVMVPTSPYTEGTTMVVASDHQFPAQEGSAAEVITRTIYDYSPALQHQYWETILSSLEYYQEHACSLFPVGDQGEETGKIVAIENCIGSISNETTRTPRSISIPHAHLVPINFRQIEQVPINIWHLKLEQRLFGMIAKLPYPAHQQVWDLIQQDFKCKMGGEFILHLAPPYGYSFKIPVTESFQSFSQIMSAHHNAFSHVSNALAQQFPSFLRRNVAEQAFHPNRPNEKQAGFIPPGSYRVYIELEDSNYTIRISPAFVSHAGVMEGMGIQLYRSPQNPRSVEQTQLTTFLQDFKSQLSSGFMRD